MKRWQSRYVGFLADLGRSSRGENRQLLFIQHQTERAEIDKTCQLMMTSAKRLPVETSFFEMEKKGKEGRHTIAVFGDRCWRCVGYKPYVIENHSFVSNSFRVVGGKATQKSCHDTSSPPRSIPRPSILLIRAPMCGLSALGGTILSKFRFRRASRIAAGVLFTTGVRFQDAVWACAGLGVMFRNSAKLRLAEGVVRPNPGKGPPPPGVPIMDDGRGVALGGGVEGAWIGGFDNPARTGVGEVARYMRRLVSPSAVFPSRAAPAAVNPRWRRRAERATSGGGVRGALGGEEWKLGLPMAKDLPRVNEVMGRSSSSSSDSRGEWPLGTVDVSETNDRLGTCWRPKRAWRRWHTGDDSGSRKVFFHEAVAVADVLTLLRA